MEERVQRCNTSQMWMRLGAAAHISSPICCVFMIFETADTQHVLRSTCLHVNITSGVRINHSHLSQESVNTPDSSCSISVLTLNSRSLLKSSFIPLLLLIKRIVHVFCGDESRLKPQKYHRKPSHILTVGCSSYRHSVILNL